MRASSAPAVHAFYCRTNRFESAHINAALALLSGQERERAMQFGFERDRRDYAVAHALLRVVLGQMDSSPAITPTFSLSHTRDLVACAVGTVSVGIDVEAIEPGVKLMPIAREYFTPLEVEGLERCIGAERGSRFYELWTLKEALFKATGLSLDALKRSSFEFTHGRVVLLPSAPVPACSWNCQLLNPTPAHQLAVIASARIGEPCVVT